MIENNIVIKRFNYNLHNTNLVIKNKQYFNHQWRIYSQEINLKYLKIVPGNLK